jgi:hypothetical protein
MNKQEFNEKEFRQQNRMRSYYDFGMGILWIVAGIFFLGYRKFGLDFDFDPLISAIFGGSCILYGSFRIWRGYKTKQQAG